MAIAARSALRIGGLLLSVGVAVSAVGPASLAAGETWHLLAADDVSAARLTQPVLQAVDPSITAVEYLDGGVGNIEVCGFVRTERISASRQSRWTTAGTREGRTLILQFQALSEGRTAMDRIKQAYSTCTPQSFTNPDRVTVRYQYLDTERQVRLTFAIYTSAAKTDIQRAESLTIQRAGGALIVTRAIVSDVLSTRTLRPTVNTELNARQYLKYKRAAFF